MSVDIHAEWARLRGANAGEVLSFTLNLVTSYWRLTEDPVETPSRDVRRAIIDDYRRRFLKSTYDGVFNISADLIYEQTGIALSVDFLLDKPESGL